MNTPNPVDFETSLGVALLSVAEVAAIARCHPQTVRLALKTGELAGFKVGPATKRRQIRIQPSAVAAWLSPAVTQ